MLKRFIKQRIVKFESMELRILSNLIKTRNIGFDRIFGDRRLHFFLVIFQVRFQILFLIGLYRVMLLAKNEFIDHHRVGRLLCNLQCILEFRLALLKFCQ